MGIGSVWSYNLFVGITSARLINLFVGIGTIPPTSVVMLLKAGGELRYLSIIVMMSEG